jgi:hypothetical protein
MTIKKMLENDGLVTTADLDAAKGNTSRFQYLVNRYGLANADKIMRNLEVRSWK